MGKARGKGRENDKNVANSVDCGKHAYRQEEVVQFRASLLHWYDSNARVLPWREAARPASQGYIHDHDTRGYSTLVSEVMLQQTQVATVVDYYTRWMARWPTVASLAAATVEEVQEMWSGLGYYSRGRRLLEAAARVVEGGGRLPRTARALQELPGVGRYTAAAVASIAFGEVEGLVDGNVIRVLARVRRIGGMVEDKGTVEALWSLANTLVDQARPGEFNQALMELGATVCTPRTPSCSSCPIAPLCGALASVGEEQVEVEECHTCLPRGEVREEVTSWPRKKKKKEAAVRRSLVCVVSRGEEVAMVRRPPTGLLANLLEFPTILLEQEEQENKSKMEKKEMKVGEQEKLEELLLSQGIEVQGGLQLVGELVHVFSHIHMTYVVYRGQLVEEVKVEVKEEQVEEKVKKGRVKAKAVKLEDQEEVKEKEVQWLGSEEFGTCGTSTAMRKVYTEAKAIKGATKVAITKATKRKRVEDGKQKSITSFFKKEKE